MPVVKAVCPALVYVGPLFLKAVETIPSGARSLAMCGISLCVGSPQVSVQRGPSITSTKTYLVLYSRLISSENEISETKTNTILIKYLTIMMLQMYHLKIKNHSGSRLSSNGC